MGVYDTTWLPLWLMVWLLLLEPVALFNPIMDSFTSLNRTLLFFYLCSVRISNELGRGNAKAAKFSIKVVLSTSIFIGVFFWILCLVFGHDIAYLFTSDEEVVEMVSSLSVLLAFSILLNSVQSVLTGKYL